MNYSNKEDWSTDKQKEIDLQLENRNLETEIELRGGVFGKLDSLDPSIENEFLKQVIAFEEADKDSDIPMRLIFPSDYQFPPVSKLSEKELETKLDDIAMIFQQHNVELDYSENLPDVLLYKHLTEEVIPNEKINPEPIPGFVVHLNGCTGDCESCFQKDYCSTAKELDEEEENE